MKFCPKCGTPVAASASAPTASTAPTKNVVEILESEPPPQQGITIEFPYSSSASFEFAVKAARAFSTFKQFGEGKKAIYRVNFPSHDMPAAMELVENLKGWRNRTLYVNGEKVPWDNVFGFIWCYQKRASSFKPDLYCFGYEQQYQTNPWGCVHSELFFTDFAEWFRWGRWVSDKGDWEFDKQRIRHELQRTLYNYRFCPAIQLQLVEDVLAALPNRVNPRNDPDWEFAESHDDTTQGLIVEIKRFGFKEKVVMVGVAPHGTGALEKIAKKVKGVRLALTGK